MHWKADTVVGRIRAGKWTHVVLNDQSTFDETWLLEGKSRIGTSGQELNEHGKQFADVIRAAGAQPLLLAHWADKDHSPRDRQALAAVFSRFSDVTGVALIPAGAGIARMQRELPQLDPYLSDGHHLSAAGAYLEALAIYFAITGRSPLGAARTIRGPAVEFNRGIVFADSIVHLVDLQPADAAAIQRIVASTKSEQIKAPPPLSAEIPPIPDGDPIAVANVKRTWSGRSSVLPTPQNEPTTIELRADTLYLDAGPLKLAGPATLTVENNQLVIRGSLIAPPVRGRIPPPFVVELRGSVRNGTMQGLLTIVQGVPGSLGTFNALGRYEMK
jgi:hypothetical protein